MKNKKQQVGNKTSSRSTRSSADGIKKQDKTTKAKDKRKVIDEEEDEEEEIVKSTTRKNNKKNKSSAKDKKDTSPAKSTKNDNKTDNKTKKKEKKTSDKQKSTGAKQNNKSKNDSNNIKTNDEDQSGTDSKNIKTLIEKGGAVVDEHVPNSTNFHVVPDKNNEFNGKFFDATLNLADLKENSNKFYKIQILREDNTNNYFFFCRWGRVGVAGQKSFAPCQGFEHAKNQFHAKLHDKMNNTGYDLLTIDYSKEEKPTETSKKGKKTNKESKSEVKKSNLEQPLQELLELIYNLNIMNQQMKKIGYDANKLPLGKLGKDTLKQGYEILKEIEAVIDGKKKGDLYELTSAFYSKIPHNFGFK